jgi:hypothetical protein
MRNARRVFVAATLLVLGLTGACGSPLSPAGTSCSSDGDCAAGLSCLALGSAPGGDCTTIANVCSKPCHIDGD